MCHFLEQLNGNITLDARLDISLWDSIDEKKIKVKQYQNMIHTFYVRKQVGFHKKIVPSCWSVYM